MTTLIEQIRNKREELNKLRPGYCKIVSHHANYVTLHFSTSYEIQQTITVPKRQALGQLEFLIRTAHTAYDYEQERRDESHLFDTEA